MQERDENDSKDRQAKDSKEVAVAEHPMGERRKPNQAHRAEDDGRWQKRFAVFSLVFDGIVAVSAIIGGYLIWEQLALTRESNLLTRESNGLTQTALMESKRQFDLQRRDDADAASEEWERFAKSLKQQQQDAAAQLAVAQKSVAVASDALKASEPVAISVDDFQATFVAGSPIAYRAVARNLSAYPGSKPHIVCTLLVRDLVNPELTSPWGIENELIDSLGPGQALPFECHFPVVVDAALVQKVRDLKAAIGLFTEVIVLNRFGGKNIATACRNIEGPALAMTQCQTKGQRYIY
jgi:hypothetical protein